MMHNDSHAKNLDNLHEPHGKLDTTMVLEYKFSRRQPGNWRRRFARLMHLRLFFQSRRQHLRIRQYLGWDCTDKMRRRVGRNICLGKGTSRSDGELGSQQPGRQKVWTDVAFLSNSLNVCAISDEHFFCDLNQFTDNDDTQLLKDLRSQSCPNADQVAERKLICALSDITIFLCSLYCQQPIRRETIACERIFSTTNKC